MPKKKLKTPDSKKTALTETADYQLITLEENHVHQIKHENLIQRVWNTTVLFGDVERAVKENEKNDYIIIEWQTYLSCDKIPKPIEPEKIRNFFDKSLHDETEDVENTINWLLAINERSILNQDIDSINMTKMFLKNYQIDFGVQYDIRICDTMELLRRMEEFLECTNKDVSRQVLHDIVELKYKAQSKIYYYIDNLTYRVLSSEAAYMESIDVTTAEYSYQGKHFDIHLWTFQNVPIYLDPDETKSKTIELRQIKTDLVIPFSVLSENMVIRGLHCHFDHLSPIARYNEMPINDEIEPSLKICLQKEWASELKIQAEIKANMIKERADFEEMMRLKAEEEELKAKEAKKDDKAKKASPNKKESSVKLKKLPKEPPIVTPDLVPIVRKDFLERDSQDYFNTIINYHPDKLRLSKGEVNLRKFQILGGIYQINSLSKPKATNFPKLIMTWYKTDKHVENKNYHIDSDDYSQIDDDISKFFEIIFELPDCFCHWSEPIVCFFEEHQSSVDDDNDLCEATKNLKIGSPVIVNDFNLQEIFTKPMMYDFIENSIPRVISSFKFPEDFHDEDDDKKSKSTLARSKTTAENEETNKEHEMQKQLLSFEVQNNPERLFPLFKNVLPVVILPMQGNNEKKGIHAYENFSDFFSTLESIKNSYRKSTFRDRLGNHVKIFAEEYERNIRRSRITTKLVAYEQAELRKSSGRPSLNKGGQDPIGGRQSFDRKASLKTGRLSLKASDEVLNTKPQKLPKPKSSGNISFPKDENHLNGSKNEEIDDKKQGLFSKWSTTNILKSVFNANEKKVTIWTDRLGTFGFAFNRYEHFPFNSWSLQPCGKNFDELELKIESAHALFRIYITKNGYSALVTDFSKTVRNRKVFLEIKEPINDLRIFQKKLREKFLNIFPEVDAIWYVNGDFSQKHLAAELHTYDCMSLNGLMLKFHSSNWNKLSNRRTMVLALGELRELEQDFCLVRVTPEDAMFVEIKEVTKDLGIVELEYVSTWRNLEWYGDLNQLIKSNFGDISDFTVKDQNIIIFFLRNLLHSIKLLSFS